mmetsp:Transcript_12973/g.43636  ORF Transcript_12973/g.43636 Transcript_12973/m.43636 type:complete len:360 (+) Transcript_12973:437-1516(+)
MPARSPATPSRMPPTSRPAPSMMLLTSSRTSPMMWPTSPQTLPRRADTTSRVELSACATKPMTPPSSSLTFTLTLASFMSASPAARRISTTNSLMLVRRFLVKLSTASSSVLRPSKRPFSPSMSVDSLYFATNAYVRRKFRGGSETPPGETRVCGRCGKSLGAALDEIARRETERREEGPHGLQHDHGNVLGHVEERRDEELQVAALQLAARQQLGEEFEHLGDRPAKRLGDLREDLLDPLGDGLHEGDDGAEDRLDERNDREDLRLLGGGALLLDGLLEPLNDLNVVGEEVADERPDRVQHDADAAPRVVEEPLHPPDDATDQREDVVEKQDDEAVDAVEEVLDLCPDGGEGLVDVLE